MTRAPLWALAAFLFAPRAEATQVRAVSMETPLSAPAVPGAMGRRSPGPATRLLTPASLQTSPSLRAGPSPQISPVPQAPTAFLEPLALAAAPLLPEGAAGVELTLARTPQDVSRLVPNGINSEAMVAGLRMAVRKYGPIRIREYSDSLGGSFVGLDLQGEPYWLEHIPQLDPHERVIIRKLLRLTPDVQVVVREEGKTPDLIVNGRVTELKTIKDSSDFDRLVSKANSQVTEFSNRHALAGGDLAIDFADEARVPAATLDRLKAWAAQEGPVNIARIMAFSREDLQVFSRTADGSFEAAGAAADLPPAAASELHAAQLLAKRGLIGKAEQRLRALGAFAPGQEPASPAVRARRSVEDQRFLKRVRKLSRRDPRRAAKFWSRFQKVHGPERAARLSGDVDAILRPTGPGVQNAFPADDRNFVAEVREPHRVLRLRGVAATVTIFGSARILAPDVARGNLDETLRVHGDSPATPEGRAALGRARRDLAGSRWYEEARRLAGLIARGGGGRIAVATGGGPGIMEAANRGAFEAGGPSVGFNIKLEHEQAANPYITKGFAFDFANFSSRKMNLRQGAVAYAFFQGGFGTLDELFEILTLIQTGKQDRVPIVLVGDESVWRATVDFEHLVAAGMIAPSDLELIRYADSAEEAWAEIEPAIQPVTTNAFPDGRQDKRAAAR